MRRIMAVNVLALGILGGGILYLNQFREDLIEQRVAALATQAETIAGAIGESAGGGPETTTIEVETARQIIGRLVGPSDNRARLFTVDGELIADSRFMALGRSVFTIPLPPPGGTLDWRQRFSDWLDRALDTISPYPDFPPYAERPGQTASDYGEVMAALSGESETRVRSGEEGILIISASAPVQRFRRVLGALMLSTDTRDIQQLVRQERLTILKVFGLSLGVTLLLSFFLAGTIARPIRRLARAADTVRRGIGRTAEMPDISNRRDEIGDLSRSVGAMTRALYRQIDAIESFAADVSHELKNPLTSMRSALETVQRTEDKKVQARLLAILEDDVHRLDRLISDISDASRLDAELTRGRMAPVDLGALINTLVEVYRATANDGVPTVAFTQPESGQMVVHGIEDRLGQVVRNLLDNAISFSPPGGTVTVKLARRSRSILLTVEDEGPGLPSGAAEKIFSRFYSERPTGEAFGRHSGLGLSISRQVVEAHSGEITAENRAEKTKGGEDKILGARFIVRLPPAP